MSVEQTAQEALSLFRQGKDTSEVAKVLQIGEARVSKLIWWARCKEKSLPADYLSSGILKRIAA